MFDYCTRSFQTCTQAPKHQRVLHRTNHLPSTLLPAPVAHLSAPTELEVRHAARKPNLAITRAVWCSEQAGSLCGGARALAIAHRVSRRRGGARRTCLGFGEHPVSDSRARLSMTTQFCLCIRFDHDFMTVSIQMAERSHTHRGHESPLDRHPPLPCLDHTRSHVLTLSASLRSDHSNPIAPPRIAILNIGNPTVTPLHTKTSHLVAVHLPSPLALSSARPRPARQRREATNVVWAFVTRGRPP